jgi:SAM-dependent methyltransferase/predicted O-methyltransferase YrrM
MTAASVPRPAGVDRVRTLWRLWRNERDDPAPFYRLLAAEAVDDLERRYGPLKSQTVLDLGCGPGWYAEALRDAGAVVLPLDGDLGELDGPDGPPAGAVLGDAGRLPVPDSRVDGVLCSNMLEHTPTPDAVLADIVRVLRPGGWAYVSWTNWFSPWGGHDMSPWHMLGTRLGPRVYERFFGPPRKNRAGDGLYPVHIGPTLHLVGDMPGVDLERVEPRYWPWARAVTAVPGVREVVTWNCVLRLRKPLDDRFEAVWGSVADVEGWLSVDQARRLWDRAREVRSSGSIVEIGSYRGRSAIVLATAAADDVSLVAIDPHAGNDRGPQEWQGTAAEGQSDHEAFVANLERAGVANRVRHVRRFSQDAIGEVDDRIDLLYIDGAHGFGPAREDLVQWGAKVAPSGTMLVHDAFSSVGVTLALMTTTFLGGDLRYLGRTRSLVEFRRERLSGIGRLSNAARQAAQLPWFVRNLLIKALVVARLPRLARLLGQRDGTWPY